MSLWISYDTDVALSDQYTTTKALWWFSGNSHYSSAEAWRSEDVIKMKNIYMRWLTMSVIMFCLYCIFIQRNIICWRPQSNNTCESAEWLSLVCHFQTLPFYWAFTGSLVHSSLSSCNDSRRLSDLKVLSLNASAVTFDWKYWSGPYCCCTMLYWWCMKHSQCDWVVALWQPYQPEQKSSCWKIHKRTWLWTSAQNCIWIDSSLAINIFWCSVEFPHHSQSSVIWFCRLWFLQLDAPGEKETAYEGESGL